MEFQTKSDLAYERIRQAILDGSIPIGAKLTVTNLVDQYGMSPMPIREALTKLAQDGLVQSTPHHGARVAEFNYYDHLESSLIRSALEKLSSPQSLSSKMIWMIPERSLRSVKIIPPLFLLF